MKSEQKTSSILTVSVIVPNYNHARFLRQRLDSILEQTYTDYELILLDDCSRDHSVEILKEYAKHPQVTHFVVNDTNSGSPFAQWKKGIELAQGDYIWIAESDDHASEHFLKTLTPHFQNDPDLAVAYCRSERIDEHDNHIATGHFWADGLDPRRWHSDFTNQGEAEIGDYLRFRNTIPNASSALFKRSIAKKIDFPIRMRFSGDWLVWLQMLQHGNIAFDHRPLNFFRFHRNTTGAVSNLDAEKQRTRERGRCLVFASQFANPRLIADFPKYQWLYDEWSRRIGGFNYGNLLRRHFPWNVRISLFVMLLTDKILRKAPGGWKVRKLLASCMKRLKFQPRK